MSLLPDDVAAAAKRFQQGDLIADVLLVEVADLNHPLTKYSRETRDRWLQEGRELSVAPVKVTTPFSCVISQTCDVISPSSSRPTIKIAPVVAHGDPQAVGGKRRQDRESRIASIKSGRNIHLVHLDVPHADFPAGGVVDLQSVTTVEKSVLIGKEPLRTLATPQLRRDFAFRAAHVFDRPAIPPPFDDHVVAMLRKELLRLEVEDPTSFALLSNAIEDEWIWLDDEDAPKIGQLVFVGARPIPDDVKKILGDWWEDLQDTLPPDCHLLENSYDTFETVSLAKGRAMSLLTHWYLSGEQV